MESINNILLKKVLNVEAEFDFECDALVGVNDQEKRRILTYCSDARYVDVINGKDNVIAVFTKDSVAGKISDDKAKIIVEDPIWSFFQLMNFLTEQINFKDSTIGKGCIIARSSSIPDKGVEIADNVIIEDNVVIFSGVKIGQGCIIKAGAVLGSDGFEKKRTSKGIISVKHDGWLIISDQVEIGVNSFVAKGFSYRHTVIEREVKIDDLVHVAHGVHIGKSTLIAANAMVSGHATIGDNVWIGPSSSISNRVTVGNNASVTIGAVVVGTVPEGETVTGNFAIQHMKFLRNFKDSLKK
ncbi:MAG: DapH/DapD/GlmU-related protein [Endozoicomonas sp.]